MFLDIQPTGGGRRKIVSRKQIQNIKKGGEIGDQIRAMREHHHDEHEVPKAEEQMENALENWPEEKVETKISQPEEKSFLQKLQSFFTK